MRIIDDSTKKLHWWNRNYFYATTIAVVLVNVILYGTLGGNWENPYGGKHIWYSTLDLSNFVRAFFNCFSHSNWQHVLLNMLCFFICGLYLERKEGTLPFLALVLALTFFSALAAVTLSKSLGWHGFSGANFALYAYIIVDYIFVFRKRTRTKFNIIAGAVMLGLIYFASCFNGGTASVGFEWYPYDFLNNAGHYSGFVAGAILGLFAQLCRFRGEKEAV